MPFNFPVHSQEMRAIIHGPFLGIQYLFCTFKIIISAKTTESKVHFRSMEYLRRGHIQEIVLISAHRESYVDFTQLNFS